MALRAIRGAVQVEKDESAVLVSAVAELLKEILRRNDLEVEALVSVLFTATPDLHSEFPAVAARGLGITDVPLLCAQEIDVAAAMPRVVRVLAYAETPRERRDVVHVYLGAAAALRKDIAQ